MKRRLWILILLCIAHTSSGQYIRMVVDQLDIDLGYQPHKNVKLGFIDTKGKLVIPFKYANGRDFIGNYANIILDSIYGVVDRNGNEILFPEYDMAYGYTSELAIVEKGGKLGVVNFKGDLIVPLEYDRIKFFSEGYTQVKKGSRWRLIDSLGNFHLSEDVLLNGDLVFGSLTKFKVFQEDSIKPKFGLISVRGEVVVPPRYDDVFLEFSNGMCWVKKGKQCGFVNRQGEEVIPLIYEDLARNFNFGLVAAKKDGLWGYIDTLNNVIIDFEYDKAHPFSEGIAAVEKNKKVGFIDLKGNLIIPIKYEPSVGMLFQNGLCPVKVDGKFGFIRPDGQMAIPPIYASASRFSEGLAWVKLEEGKEGFINTAGEMLTSWHQQAWSFRNGLARVTVAED